MEYSNPGHGSSTRQDKIHVRSRNSRDTSTPGGFTLENSHLLDKSIHSNLSQPPIATLTFENQGTQPHPFASQFQEMPTNPMSTSDFSGQLQTPHLRSHNSVEAADAGSRYQNKPHSHYFQQEKKQLEDQLSETQRQLTSMQAGQMKHRREKKRLKHEVESLKQLLN